MAQEESERGWERTRMWEKERKRCVNDGEWLEDARRDEVATKLRVNIYFTVYLRGFKAPELLKPSIDGQRETGSASFSSPRKVLCVRRFLYNKQTKIRMWIEFRGKWKNIVLDKLETSRMRKIDNCLSRLRFFHRAFLALPFLQFVRNFVIVFFLITVSMEIEKWKIDVTVRGTNPATMTTSRFSWLVETSHNQTPRIFSNLNLSCCFSLILYADSSGRALDSASFILFSLAAL